MAEDSGHTVSPWMAALDVMERHPLAENIHAEVCIVGAGIAGMTTAYLLARAGRSVVVIDDGAIGGGMTARTTAHLSNALDDRYFELERLHGAKGARIAAQSHTAAIDCIEAIVAAENIECGFERVDGFLFLPPGAAWEFLERELRATHRAGLAGIERVARAPIASFDTGPCLRFPRQAQYHPLNYLAGLARACERDGGRIFTGTHAAEIEGGAGAHVTTSAGHVVAADAIVIATNSPVNDVVTIHTKQAAYTTYAIAARIPRGSVARALYWDTLDPYHYTRVLSPPANDRDDRELLIVGGEDHRTAQADDADQRHARVEAWARAVFPMMEEVEYRWSGQVLEPVDGVAFIGRNPGDARNVYVATGDSGMGLTHGTIAGMLIGDLIMGRANDWAPLYDPSRRTLRAAPEFVRVNLNVTMQYVEGYLLGGDVDSVDDIMPGEGAVVRRGLKKIAACRDEDGVLHECSAVCTHLEGIVAWNTVEKSWDCPCHGSRFDRYGHVITGPANNDLDRIENE